MRIKFEEITKLKEERILDKCIRIEKILHEITNKEKEDKSREEKFNKEYKKIIETTDGYQKGFQAGLKEAQSGKFAVKLVEQGKKIMAERLKRYFFDDETMYKGNKIICLISKLLEEK